MAMQQFRGFGKSRASSALMLILIVCFAAWGVGEYLNGGAGGGALSINGQSITAREVENTLRNREQAISQMLGGQTLTAEMKAQVKLPELVLSEVIRRAVLKQAAEQLNLAPSTRHLRDELATTPMFQKEGAFDSKRYQQATAQIGLTTSGYEKLLAQDLSMRLMAPLVHVTAPSASAIMPLLQAEEAKYTIETFTLNPNNLPAPPAASAQILEQFYKTNQQAYAIPEKRSISVITLNATAISNTISVPEEQITARYEENKDSYKQPEKRQVRHILVATAKEATDTFNRIKSKDDFIRIASENSLDPMSKKDGGNLGSIAEADVVPAFAKVAFEAQPNTLAGPVETPFGWHLIWVEGITAPQTPPLSEVHAQIQKELVAEQTDEALQNLLRTIDDRTAAGENLEAISKATGLHITRHPLLTTTTEGVDPALVSAAFEAEANVVTGPITTKGNSLDYIEVTKIEPAKVPPLAEIETQLRKDIESASRQTVLLQQAQQLITAAQQTGNTGQPLASIAASLPQQPVPLIGQVATASFKNPTDAPEWLHANLLDLYQLPTQGILAMPVRNGENQVVVRLTERTIPQLSTEAAASAAKTYAQQLQQNTEALLINQLVASADVNYNVNVLRQLFGADWNLPR